jgi:thioredoxin reductase
VLAYGISDGLPSLAGLAERWGKSVLHCPYCHGYEYAGAQLGVLQTLPMSSHQACLIADWGPTTLYLNGGDMPGAEALEQLKVWGVRVVSEPIASINGDGATLSSITLANGRVYPLQAMFLAPRSRFNSVIAEDLGCALDETPLGPMIRTDASKQTTIPGVYAAGDIARAPHSATWASADGVTAGMSLHQALVFASALH